MATNNPAPTKRPLPVRIDVPQRTTPENLLGLDIIIHAVHPDPESRYENSVAVTFERVTDTDEPSGEIEVFVTTSEVLKTQLEKAETDQGFPVLGTIKAGASRNSGQTYYTFG